MRPLIVLMPLVFALSAHAQELAAPTVAAPVAPAVPRVAAPASPQDEVMRQLRASVGAKSSPEAMGQVVVIGTMIGCTQKTAGKTATQAFYQKMQAIGKMAEDYCKQNRANDAKNLLMATFLQNKDNAVVKSALQCYDAQQSTIASFGGARMAANAANYARWLRNPALATQELKNADICAKSTPAPAQAVAPQAAVPHSGR